MRNSKVQLVRWGEGGAWGHDRVWWYGVCLTNQFSGFNPGTAKEKKLLKADPVGQLGLTS